MIADNSAQTGTKVLTMLRNPSELLAGSLALEMLCWAREARS